MLTSSQNPASGLLFSAFRMTRIEASLGYVEYKVILQHQESLQQVGALMTSLADVQSHAFEMTGREWTQEATA